MDLHPTVRVPSLLRTPSFSKSPLISKLRSSLVVLAVGTAAIVTGDSVSAQDATLKMRFVCDGAAPALEYIDPNKDAAFCGKNVIPNEKLIVNPENNGIKNVVVHVYTRTSGDDLPETAPANATHVLANEKCRFEPHIVIARTGDKLKITNPDPVGHNANLNFIRNTPQNLMIPSGQAKIVDLVEEEPTAMPVECNIHPWMKAFVVVLEHPFVDVSDGDGNITIEGLPAGKEITFAIRYEGGKIDEVKVGGKETEWKRQRFEVDLKAGDNDLGDILVPADALSAD